MKNRRHPAVIKGAGLFLISALLASPLAAASIQGAKPEDVGLSSDRLQRIHEVMERHIQAGDIAGGVTLVARKGRLAHLQAHGVMDLESRKRMPKDGIFRIASMSKPITGTAILMLMEEGKIRLTDPVSKFIPEFRGLKVAVTQQPATAAGTAEPQFYTVPANREITIRDLLTHVSGLVSGPISTAEAAKFPRQPNDTLADYIPRVGAVPLEFQPGSQWHYSPGAGFDTLGRIVEIVSGQSFDQFLRQRIFDPLGIKDLYFKPGEAGMLRLATVYRKNSGSLEKQTRPDYDGGHLIYLQRMDGTQVASVIVAQEKAACAIRFKRPTKALEDVVAGGRTVVMKLAGAVPVEGGLPIVVSGEFLGAIGISGVTSAQDGQVAAAGLTALAGIS